MFVAVLSDKPELREQFCKMFGVGAAKGDINVYSASGMTLVEPARYPEKILPLLQTLSMADFVVLIVDGLTPKVGELIVALNSLRIESGLLISSVPLPVKGTVIEKYEKAADMAAAKEKMLAVKPAPGGESLMALIDRTVAVPSVGHVAHGVLKSGKLKKHERLFVLPEKKEIEVRGITADGHDAEEAGAGARIELAFKGDMFERGLLVPLRNEFQIENVVNGRLNMSPFFKDELKGKIHAYTNMQYVEGHLTENDLTLSQPLAFEKGEIILVIDASNQKLRIAGTFQSKW